jgi:hypothetical protein
MLSVKKADGATVSVPTPCSDSNVFHYAGSALTPVATPTDIIKVFASASKTVYLRRIRIGGAATAAGSMVVVVTKRTTAGTTTSATLTAVTPCPPSTGVANTGTVKVVSVANVDAQGTAAGVVAAGRINMVAIGSAATSGAGEVFEFVPVFPPCLAADSVEEFTIEGGGSAVPSGGKIDWEVVIEEV